jgi:hypothetical protein
MRLLEKVQGFQEGLLDIVVRARSLGFHSLHHHQHHHRLTCFFCRSLSAYVVKLHEHG